MDAANPTPAPHEPARNARCGGPDPDLLRATDWSDLVPRLIAYANYRASRYGKASAIYKSRAEDYAHDAVKLFLDGTRVFASDCPLFQFLCGIVDSLISHDVEKAGRRGRVVSIVSAIDEEVASDCIRESQIPSADDLERRILAADELRRFLKSLDPDLRAYARLRMEEQQTAAGYAEALGVTENVIRNMDKRIKRRRNECSTNHATN